MKTFAIALFGLTLSLGGCRSGGEWDGGATIIAEVRVLSDLGDHPVPNASIEFISRKRAESYAGLNRTDKEQILKAEGALAETDEGGIARVTLKGGAGGIRTPFGLSGSKSFSGELFVNARGFKPYSTSLRNSLPNREFGLKTEKVAFTVYLIPENKK